MGTYFTQGLLLKHQDYREVDRMIMAYTKEYGKLFFVAKGSRKITSKLGGSLEPFCIANLSIIRGRTFNTVTAVEVIHNFNKLKKSVSNVYIASKLAEVIDATTKEYQRDARIYTLLEQVSMLFDTGIMEKKKRNMLVWYFVLRLVSYLGYQPELYTCLLSGKQIANKDNFFSYQRGGLIALNARPHKEAGSVVTPNTVKMLRLIIKKKPESLFDIRVDDQTEQALNTLISEYLQYTQESDIRLERVLTTA